MRRGRCGTINWILNRYLLLCAAAALLALAAWLPRYFCTLAPRRGTAEWISRTVPQKLTLIPGGCLYGGRWQAPIGAALLGAAVCPLRLMTFSAALLPYLLLSALTAALFCMLLLLLSDSLAAASFGTLLLLAAGKPGVEPLPAVCILMVFALLLSDRGPTALWVVLLTALLGLAARMNAVFLLLAPGIALSYGFFRSACRRESGGVLWRILLFLLLTGIAVPLAAAVQELLENSWRGDWAGLLTSWRIPAFSLPDLTPSLLLLPAAPAALIAGLRLRDGRSIAGGLLGLACLPLCFFGGSAIAGLGGIAALACTFGGAWPRGARVQMAVTTILLIFCMYFAG